MRTRSSTVPPAGDEAGPDPAVGNQALRTCVFAATAVALFAVARFSGQRAPVLVMVLVFAVVATLWVRGQYVDSLSGRRGRLPDGVIAAVALLGVGLVAVWVLGPPVDGLGVAGVALLYFAAGSAVTAMRERVGGQWRVGAGLVLAGVVAMGIGGWSLGRPDGVLGAVPPVLIGGSLLLLFPVGGALLAESVIQRLCRQASSRWLWLLVGGLVVLVVVAALAVAVAGSAWVLVLLAVLALLTVAVASSTQADVAVVLAVVALMGVIPRPASVPSHLEPRDASQVLVALGDSYMSGEGAAVHYAGTDDGGKNACRRSPTSWAAMAGQQEPFDGLVFLACSGARTRNLREDRASVPPPEPQLGERATQLARYRSRARAEGFQPGLVVLTVGGNDAGFSTIGLMCLAPGDCSEQQTLWTDGLDQVEKLLRGTYAEVRATFPDTPVVVVPYPRPISSRGGTCDQVALTPGEKRFISSFVAQLDDRVERVAREHGFHYLAEMEQALADSGLQLCDPANDGRPGLHFIGLRSVSGIAEQRFHPANWAHSSLHPNERGHAAMLRVFQEWLPEDLSTLAVRAPADGTARPASDAAGVLDRGAVVRAPCDLYDVTHAGCRAQGARWAQQQVGRMLTTWGVLGLVAAGAAWSAGVALFARRRRAATTRLRATATGEVPGAG